MSAGGGQIDFLGLVGSFLDLISRDAQSFGNQEKRLIGRLFSSSLFIS